MAFLKQSTAYNRMLLMVDSSDHISGKAGLTLTLTASKNGGAFGSITPTVTDRGSGWYNLALTTGNTDTLGDLAVHATSAGADPTDFTDQIVAVDLADAAGFGLSRIDVAISTRNSTTPPTVAAISTQVWSETTRALTDKAGFALSSAGVQAIWDALTSALTTVGSIGKRIADNVDAQISTRLSTAGYTAPDNAGITTLTGRLTAGRATNLDNLDTTVSSRSNHSAADVWAVTTRALTDKVGFALSVAGVAAIWDALVSGITTVGSIGKRIVDDLDTTISSRLSSGGYTAPDNAGITTLVSRLTAGRAGNLDNLDVLVSSRYDGASYVAPDNAGIATLVARLTAGRATLLDNLANLDALVSDLLTAAAYTAPDNANIGVLVGRLTATRAGLLDNLTRLDVAVSSVSGGGGGGGGDPLLNEVPGTYDPGTAGYALGRVGALGTGVTVVSGPVVSEGGLIKLVQGDSYYASEGRALTWTSASWPSLVGATVKLFIRTSLQYDCAVAGQVVSLELSDEVTRGLLGQYPYELIATLGNGHLQTLAQGTLLVERI